jgi:hypothetical protein
MSLFFFKYYSLINHNTIKILEYRWLICLLLADNDVGRIGQRANKDRETESMGL